MFDVFGFSDLDLELNDFQEKDTVVEIGREPLKIQILTGIDGVEFDECYEGRQFLEYGALKIPFIGFNELLKNKKASPRAKDKIEFDELQRLKEEEETDGQ